MRVIKLTVFKAAALLLVAAFSLGSLQVTAQTPDGGMVQTEGGRSSTEVCINGQPSIVSFDSMGVAGSNFRYIITDANDQVLNIKANDQQNFEPAGAGECHVWGIAYDGNLQNTSRGTPVTEVSASNGDSLSRNFINVTRIATNGGTVQTESGKDTARVFIDNTSSIVDFDSMGVEGRKFRYIITDDNREVLNVKPGDQQNFNPAGQGVCYVYGFAYSGNLQNTSRGTPVSEVSASGCDSLSQNFVTVIRNATDGGTVRTEKGEDTVEVAINGNPSVIGFDSMNAQGNQYQYVITDENRNILNVKSSDQQNFEPAGPGVCYVYGIAYTGSLQNTSRGTPVMEVSSPDGDSLSRNFITVMRDTLDGGRIETPDGEDSVIVTINGEASVVNFSTNSVTKDRNYTYVITDATDTILNPDAGTSQNFEPAGTGLCYVYGVAHQGALNAQQGMALADITAETGLDRSENAIAVNRISNTGLETVGSSNQSVQVFPNPAESEAKVELHANNSTPAQIRITDLAGHTVIADQRQLSQGLNQLNINLKPRMQGAYIITIQQPEKAYHSKLWVE